MIKNGYQSEVDNINIYDFSATEVSGKLINFNDFRNRVLIVVNTASKCGLAPELKGLEKLYQKHHQDGLDIVGFPCQQFRQEVKSSQQAQHYCQLHYGVTFPMTKITKVNGKNANLIFKYLKKVSGHGWIKWNYTKFLIGRDGHLIHRYSPLTSPLKMENEIVKALKQQ